MLGAVGGHATVWFAILDDHLKARMPSSGYDVPSIGFNIYLLRLGAWLLSVLPSTVLLCTLRFSLLPLLALKSLSTEHARHFGFYKPLFTSSAEPTSRWPPAPLHPTPPRQPGHCARRRRHCARAAARASPPAVSRPRPTDAAEPRLRSANALIAHAHEEVAALATRLKRLPLALRHDQARRTAEVVGWPRASAAGADEARRQRHAGHAGGGGAAAEAAAPAAAQGLVTGWSMPNASQLAAMSRNRRRWLLLRAAMVQRRDKLQLELSRRSEVFRRLWPSLAEQRPESGAAPAAGAAERRGGGVLAQPLDRLLVTSRSPASEWRC